MLYQNSKRDCLSRELFINPTCEYRGAPFWAWNCKLDESLLLKEIEQLKEMGMGGFHIHSRTGLDTEYLGDEFMRLVASCNEKAKKEGMLCYLYDEDRYSSGFAGGFVTKELRYRARYLVFSPERLIGHYCTDKNEFDNAINEGNKPDGYFLAGYHVKLNNGYLDTYNRMRPEVISENGPDSWFAYMELERESSWCNNRTSVNTLDKKAIQRFVEITHEYYFRNVGDDFGKSIPSIFTDEPQFSRKQALKFASDKNKLIMPFTDDFPETYRAKYGNDILDFLPELFWELKCDVSVARYRYHDHITERFTDAFAGTVGGWCGEHGILLTGHMMGEETLESQSSAIGEVMRPLSHFQLPGIDILCDHREYASAKEAQSVAHQYGRRGVVSELYGVTNWDFDFKKHKMAGDWQAALGVTLRVPHLAWVSMAGEGKRDYPASIGYQSPWYREYPLIEDHFARLNTALMRGKPHVHIAVIHPVESYWLHWGPREQTFMVREELEAGYRNTVEWLLENFLDFDFISEALFPSLCPEEASNPLRVGEMAYDAVVVPGCHTLRSTTVERLNRFVDAGGRVVFLGESAQFVEAARSASVEQLYNRCISIPFNRIRLTDALQDFREIDIRLEDGTRPDNLLHQLRTDGENRWLFIAHGYEKLREGFWDMVRSKRLPFIEKITIRMKGTWNPTEYDTVTGAIKPCPARIAGNETWIEYDLSVHGSLLLFLEPGEPSVLPEGRACAMTTGDSIELQNLIPIMLSEPNVLLMDMAEYSVDGEQWEKEEEILRIDNILRKKFGYPLREEAAAQPWTDRSVAERSHILKLRFRIDSDTEVALPELAMENPEAISIHVNGEHIPSAVCGWFVDESIKTIRLPNLKKGQSEIVLSISYGPKANVEWCYLLGSFGVSVVGRNKRIVEFSDMLSFGDWTQQGLPFYAGNVTYCCKVLSPGGYMTLKAPHFSTPLLSVALNGIERGKIAFAPYALDLGYVEKGEHTLSITAFGNRFNAFGQVHNCDKGYFWFASCSWRTTGDRWSYQYQLKPMGILVSPDLVVYDVELPA